MAENETHTARYRALSHYSAAIMAALERQDYERAVSLLFQLSGDLARRFLPQVSALSEAQADFLASPKSARGEAGAFLQAFQALLIEMEDAVLDSIPGEVRDDAEQDDAEDAAPASADIGALFAYKKSLIPEAAKTPFVTLDAVERRFGAKKRGFTLGPISLEIRPTEVVAVLGPNGAGKTTLLRLIAGDLAPSAGEIDFTGLRAARGPAGLSGWAEIRARVAYVPPSPARMTENTVEALWRTGLAFGAPPDLLERTVPATLHRFGLGRYADDRVSELSTGYRLRFELARMLFADPALIVLDEPLANLDRNAQLTVLEDLRGLAASLDSPRAVVVGSQHLAEIAAIADRLIFLEDGRLIYSGKADALAEAFELALFEITPAGPDDALIRLLRRAGAVEIDRTAVSIFALFPRDVDQGRLIRDLAAEGVAITAFRDLSASIEALMIRPRFRHANALGAGPVAERAATAEAAS